MDPRQLVQRPGGPHAVRLLWLCWPGWETTWVTHTPQAPPQGRARFAGLSTTSAGPGLKEQEEEEEEEGKLRKSQSQASTLEREGDAAAGAGAASFYGTVRQRI